MDRNRLHCWVFATYEGTVIASHYWSGEMAVMPVPPACTGSWDSVLHSAALRMDADNVALVFTKQQQEGTLGKTIKGQRAIGVVYNPAFERWGNYVPTSLAQRCDVMLFIDKTNALEPLDVEVDPKETEESYPYRGHGNCCTSSSNKLLSKYHSYFLVSINPRSRLVNKVFPFICSTMYRIDAASDACV